MPEKVSERNVRLLLTDWKFWMMVAYFWLAALMVALYVVFGRTAHEESIRTSTQKAAAATQVGQCFTSVKNAPVVQGFLDGQDALLQNSILTNEALLRRSLPGDPLTMIRRASLARLRPAASNSKLLRGLIAQTTPTRKKCKALARSLHVNASRYERRH